jgi:hypothetical protein
MTKVYPPLMTTALGLLFGRGDIGGCRFEMDGTPDPAPQQLMVENPDASSDIEERPWRDAEVTEALQDQPGSPARSPLPVLRQLRLCSSRREMAIRRYTMATRHGLHEDAAGPMTRPARDD